MQPIKKMYTPEEYLVLEEKAARKSEYYRGEIFAMAGGSINHNRIARNVCNALTQAFDKRPCEAFISDVRLWLEHAKLYTYPDVMVICGEPKFVPERTDTLTNPLVIVEVLSPSTQLYDCNSKFLFYRGLETLQDYLLIEQDKIYLDYYHKLGPNEWHLKTYEAQADFIRLEAIEVELSVEQIYARVSFGRIENRPNPQEIEET